MKNILVPTDFSTESYAAYQVALQLARQTGGHITLLHVLEGAEVATGNFSTSGGPSGVTNSDSGIDQIFTIKLLEVIKRRMHRLMDEAGTLAPGVKVQDTVEMGRIGDGILTAIERHSIDLVVMGAQGHGAMENFFVSSTTERLIRLAPCPVLTVKHSQANFEVRNIVFPSDFSAETAGAIDGLRQVQATFPQATLHLLHVVSSSRAPTAEQQMQAFGEQYQLPNFKTAVVDAERTSLGIEQYAQQVRADLVVIPTHARSGLSAFLQTSIAETVATHAYPPVLTYHFR